MITYRYHQPIEIRYADLDPQGHVNNAYYLSYIEQARVGYLFHLNLWDGETFSDIGIILAKVQVTFLAPIMLKHGIQIGVKVSHLGTKSFMMDYVIVDRSSTKEYATASTVIVTFDYNSRQTVPLPDSWRQKISQFEQLV